MQVLRTHLLLVSGVLLWVCVQAFPELTQNRIDAYDASLFAANGAIFLSAVHEFGQLLAHPVDWLYAYYNQYPALAVRRHPPLFGITEMVVYLFTGVSVFGAKLTAFLYSMAFAIGVYALSHKIWKDPLLAAATSFLVMATPQVIWLGTAVRLDLPALTFSVWALFHYVEYLGTNRRSSAIYFAVLSVLSIYTYQLAVFILVSAGLHLIIFKGKDLLKDKTVWIVAGILLIFILPLAIEQLYVAADNLTAATGGEVEEWKRFHPVASRLSAEFFLFYPIAWLKIYPVQTAGFIVWIFYAIRRGITRESVLLLLCAATALVFFSWMRGKDSRYAIYTMVPIAFLAAHAIWVLVLRWNQGSASTNRRRAAVGIIVGLGLAQAYALPSQNSYLSGMERPARDIVASHKNARILYAGPRDAAFVFYVREHDPERSARIYRATVQEKNAGNIAEFIRKKQINVIAWEEGDGRSGEDGFAEFRSEIKKYILEEQTFDPLDTFDLDFKSPREEKQIRLIVYKQQANK